ncbi:MAG: SH3 domain-containing protein [Hyphomicrobiaceae bacterium]
MVRSRPVRVRPVPRSFPIVALLLAGLSVLSSLLAGAGDALADLRVVRVSGGDTLNLRALPSAKSSVVGHLSFDARGIVDLGKSAGSWRYVRYGNLRGWVHGYYVQGDDPGERTHYSVVNGDATGFAVIRSWPSSLSRRIGAIPVTETGVGAAGPCLGRWCKVDYAGVKGWVQRRHLAVWIP